MTKERSVTARERSDSPQIPDHCGKVLAFVMADIDLKELHDPQELGLGDGSQSLKLDVAGIVRVVRHHEQEQATAERGHQGWSAIELQNCTL